jgi:hypothetical protein
MALSFQQSGHGPIFDCVRMETWLARLDVDRAILSKRLAALRASLSPLERRALQG